MKSSEMRPCDLCDRGLCVDGEVEFLRVRFESFVVDPTARHDKQAFEAMHQGMTLPDFVPPDEALREAAVLIDAPADLIVCETCANSEGIDLLAKLATTSLANRMRLAGNIDHGDQQHDRENQD